MAYSNLRSETGVSGDICWLWRREGMWGAECTCLQTRAVVGCTHSTAAVCYRTLDFEFVISKTFTAPIL